MKPLEQKNHREFWIEQFNGVKPSNLYAYRKRPKPSSVILKIDEKEIPASEYFHVVEYSALEAAEKKIKELEAKLWVAKDSALRTYDGLADKADKYDEANEMLEKMAAALLLYKDICTWKDESGDEFIAAKALKEYEDWKKR